MKMIAQLRHSASMSSQMKSYMLMTSFHNAHEQAKQAASSVFNVKKTDIDSSYELLLNDEEFARETYAFRVMMAVPTGEYPPPPPVCIGSNR